jgi:TolB-like protein
VTNRQSQQTRKPSDRAVARRRGLTAVLAATLGGALLPLLASATATAQSGPAQPAPAATPDSIAVLPLDVVGDIPASRPALEAAVLRGLTVAAVPSLPAGAAETRLRATGAHVLCDNADCWTALGRAIEARYLVAGKVERSDSMFVVEFQVYDSRPGRMLARETNRCEADDCSVAELCRLTVRELARQTLTKLDEGPSGGPTLASTVTAETSPLARATPDSRPAGDRPGAGSSRKKWAAAALVGGAFGVAAGAYLVRYHFSCADKACTRLNGSEWNEALIGGLAAGAVGVAALTTGVVLLLTGGERTPPRAGRGLSLSLGPQSLVLSGRF